MFKIVFLCIIFLIGTVFSQNELTINSLKTDFAKKEKRIEYLKNLDESFNLFNEKFSLKKRKEWIDRLQKATLFFYKDERVKSGIEKALLSSDNQVKLYGVEAASTLYNCENINDFKNLSETTNPSLFAISINSLYKCDSLQAIDLFNKYISKFSTDDPVIKMMKYDFEAKVKGAESLPNLKSLFQHDFGKGKTVLYSLFRKDRTVPGITIFRKPDGTFLRDKEGNLEWVTQLAVSSSNMPSYVQGGNTPQGIFSIQGWYVSPTDEIGPTPAILTRIPFGKPPEIFFHRTNKNKNWNLQDYKNLLPEEWQNYFPIYETFYAGMAKRFLIVMHGSVDYMEFYKEKPYYPLAPTRGCLSAYEKWDENTGKLIESDQLKLYNNFIKTGSTKGYLVVLEIDDKKTPVKADEIMKFIPY